MKLYTRTGDSGQTSLIGGRVDKDDARVEAYGTIDELNSLIGMAAATASGMEALDDLAGQLLHIQHELFDCGSDLSYARDGERPYKVSAEMVERLEQWIDGCEGETEPIRRFILPGGSLASAQLHVCRTVCRRAERRVVTLTKSSGANGEVRRYLNRLSDYLFAAARLANARTGVCDVEYVRGAEVFGNE